MEKAFKLKKLFIAVAGISMMLAGGCAKKTPAKRNEDRPQTEVQTNSQKLTDKNFRMTGFIVDPGIDNGNGIITDWFAQMEACEKDDLINFAPDGNMTISEGLTKCDDTAPQIIAGTWAWNADETMVNITVDNSLTSLLILTNDGTALKMQHSEVIEGITHVWTYTYTKQ